MGENVAARRLAGAAVPRRRGVDNIESKSAHFETLCYEFRPVALRQILSCDAVVFAAVGLAFECESGMSEALRPRVKYVIGPDGSPLTIADLPPSSTKRWVIRRKAEVVAAVRGGLLSLEEACSRYTLTVDEFSSGRSRSINWPRGPAHHPDPAISPLTARGAPLS